MSFRWNYSDQVRRYNLRTTAAEACTLNTRHAVYKYLDLCITPIEKAALAISPIARDCLDGFSVDSKDIRGVV